MKKITSFQSYIAFNEIFYDINWFLITLSLFVKRIYDIEKLHSEILAYQLEEQCVQPPPMLENPRVKYELTIIAIFLFFMSALITITLPSILKALRIMSWVNTMYIGLNYCLHKM